MKRNIEQKSEGVVAKASRWQRFATVVRAVLSSNRFFYGTLVVLVLESAWIALSGLFSMAYDEDTHYNVIQLYAHHLSPFWSSQPDGAATFGVVSRDLSYLYQYLMSFVYRLMEPFIHTDTPKIIVLRFISVTFLAIGFIFYRKVLLQTRASKAMVHAVLAVLVLVPTVPFLAAQINYDNMLFMMAGIMLWLTTQLITDIKTSRAGAKDLLLFLSIGMLTCLVKYPFAPVLFMLVVWLGVVYWRARGGWAGIRRLPSVVWRSFLQLSRLAKVGLLILLVLSGGLFFERYGINTIRYGTPLPECDQVLGVQRCMDYGPWRRNYLTYQDKMQGKLAPVKLDPVTYTFGTWLRLMGYQLFFALNGKVDNFSVGAPLIGPFVMAIVVGVVGFVLSLWHWRYILSQPYMKGLLALSLFYVFSLWIQNYWDYLHLHLAIAIQARYLVMVLPIFSLALAMAYAQTFRNLQSAKVLMAMAMLCILVFQGGGAEVFIMRSTPTWYWSNQTVVQANDTARAVLRKVIIGEGVNLQFK